MKALVTGISGFAGSHLATHLLDSGDQVLGCSLGGRLPGASSSRVEHFAWDIAQGVSPDVRQRVAAFAPEGIYHLAALSVPSQCGSQQPTDQALAVNVEGTRSILQLAQSLPGRPRLLLASSCYVYAPVSPQNARVSEDAALGPTGGYGKTKLAAERELLHATRARGLDAVVARAFQHTGPRQSPQMMLPQWIQQLVRGQDELRVLCLDTYLDLSDVRDVVRAYRRLMLDGRPGRVYNVGSGVCRRSGDILEQLCQMYGSQRKIVELVPGKRQHPIADITRLRTETNWQPKIPLHNTLSDTMQYWIRREQTL